MRSTESRLNAGVKSNLHRLRWYFTQSAFWGVLVLISFAADAQETTSFANPASIFESAEECRSCHEVQYDQWRSSMMGYSSISPPIHALELTENHVERRPTSATNFFGFGRLSRLEGVDSSSPHNEPRLFCQKCHAPVAVFTDLFGVYNDFDFFEQLDANGDLVVLGQDGEGNPVYDDNRDLFPDSHSLLRQLVVEDPNFDQSLYKITPTARHKENAKAAVEGVTCTVCHRMSGQDGTFNSANSSTTFNGPRPFFEKLPGEAIGDEGAANSAYHIMHSSLVNFGPYDANGEPVLSGNPADAPHALVPFHGVALSGISDGVDGIPTKVAGQDLVMGTDGVERGYLSSGLMCGSCHDVRIPFRDMETMEDFRRVENLYTEWKESPWNNDNMEYVGIGSSPSPFANPNVAAVNANGSETGRKRVTTCQDCHMSKYMIDPDARPGEYAMDKIVSGDGIGDNSGFPDRRMTNHRFVGVDRFLLHDAPTEADRNTSNPKIDDLVPFDIAAITSTNPQSSTFGDINSAHLNFGADGKADLREIMLQKAVEFKIESARVNPQDNELNIAISVENVGAGHNIPAGLSQERQVWIELEVLDREGKNIYTSGYMVPIEAAHGESCDATVLFDPFGEQRYRDTFCGENGGVNEYECDLDEFRVELDPALRNLAGVEPGCDDNLRKPEDDGTPRARVNRGLVNYQNGFKLIDAQGNEDKVLTQFIGNAIINTNSLRPFERKLELYDVPLDDHEGPYEVNARLRFRPLPHEFLAVLQKSSSQSRVTKDVIKNNKIIEMENDQCLVNLANNSVRVGDTRACNSEEPIAIGAYAVCSVFGDQQSAFNNTFNNTSDVVQCHGRNTSAQLGLGYVSSSETTAVVVPGLNNIQSIAMGASGHSCALSYAGSVSCWGEGNHGQLGDGDTSDHTVVSPTVVSDLVGVRQIDLGFRFSCAITDIDEISCWGLGTDGRLGNGDLSEHEQATPQGFFAEGVESLATGFSHGCYIGTDQQSGMPGRVYCWGGLWGNGAEAPVATPQPTLLDRQARALAAGKNFTCALLNLGEVVCWGQSGGGELGAGATSEHVTLEPQTVLLSKSAIAVGAGSSHACALLRDGSVECWGNGLFGRLGDGDTGSHKAFSPVAVRQANGEPLSGVTYLAVGDSSSCAMTPSGTRYCWGYNQEGQLGLGDTTNRGFATVVNYQQVGESTPYRQDFNAGFPTGADGWSYYSSGDLGRIQVIGDKLRMDVSTSNNFVLNEALLRVDLSNAQSATLSFFQSDHGDESHPMAESFFAHDNSDGVAISRNGIDWYRVLPSSDLETNTDGRYYSVNLDELLSNIRSRFDASFDYGPNIYFKFQQYDNYVFPTDGRQWDDIAITSFPVRETFDHQLPGSTRGWSYYSSTSVGRIETEAGRLQMDVSTSGTFNLNEAVLTLDLANRTGLLLQFFQAESTDETHEMPESFSGHHNSDGVAISADGITWYRVQSAAQLNTGLGGSDVSINLDQEVSRIRSNFDANFSLGTEFKIKFQQYDNFSMTSDGRIWDNVRIGH